jgi:hypothetical protein
MSVSLPGQTIPVFVRVTQIPFHVLEFAIPFEAAKLDPQPGTDELSMLTLCNRQSFTRPIAGRSALR